MLLFIILISIVHQSTPCEFPPYINKCPLPDPNANDCLLNSTRYALPHLLGGDPNLNLPSFSTIHFDGNILILEYNFQTNNTEIQLYGLIQPSNDVDVYAASVNLNWPNWHFLFGASLLTSDFDFTLNIYDEARTIQAKGHINVIQDNWRLNYNSDYTIEQINYQNYMQIPWSYAYLTDDTFEITYTGISTLDDEPITGPELVRVKKALRNFENVYRVQQNEIGNGAITHIFNTVLRLVPENEIFIPVANPCLQN